MRIVITTDKLTRGGKEKQILLLAQGLLERSHDVYILSKNTIDPHNFFYEIEFPHKRIHSYGKGLKFAMRKRFIRKMVDLAPDVILNFDVKSSLWTELLSRKLKKTPAINCSIRRATPYQSRRSNFLSKTCLRKSKYIIAISQAGLKHYGIEEDSNHIVIHCGINKEKYANANPLPFEKIFNVKNQKDSFVIANIGNLFEHKGQQTLIEAIGKLKSKHIYAFIIGKGPLHNSLQSKINALGLTERVKLVGLQSNVEQYLKSADLYVNPSFGEGFSNAVLEAMACGLPVITTPDGGIPEVVNPYTTNYFEKKNVEELAELIAGAIKNRKEQTKDENQEWIKKYSIEKMVDQFESFINRIVTTI